MSSSGFSVPITDEISAKLDDYPVGARGAALERAISRALDAEGWPSDDRGAISIPISYWYVNVIERGPLRTMGHVGPISDAEQAKHVARSWRQTGRIALVARRPDGPALTNAF